MAKKDKDYILKKCFECYVKNGLEATTTRNFCLEADVNINTLYRFFGSKNDIFIECVNYGFNQLESSFCDTLKDYEESSFEIFPKLVKIGMDYSPQMRFLHQAVSSPAYEEYRDEQFKWVNGFYDRIGEKIAAHFDCPYALIKDYIHEMMTLLSYFSLWGSADMAAIQFSRIFIDFKDAITGYKKLKG